MSEAKAKTQTLGADGISDSVRNYVLFALFLASTWNFIDRVVVGVVQEALKKEFGLTDFMLGLLGGPAFSFLYVFLGIPSAWLADRYNRANILSIALAAWSALTAACGLATNFGQLLLFRAGVGIGEAGCSPTAHSMIGDYFPPEKRSFAFAVFASGVSVGSLIAGLLGGWLAMHYGWRGTFIILGLSGLVIALGFKLTVREPPRRSARAEAPPLFKTAAFLFSKPIYRHIVAGNALAALIGYSYTAYLTSHFVRTFEMPIGEAAMHVALVNGLAGAAGTYLGGFLGDYFGRRGPHLSALVASLGFLIALPLMIVGFLVRDPTISTALLMFGTAAQLMYFGPAFSLVQGIAEPRMRATAAALLLFVVNLVGLTLGPPLLGFLSDFFNQQIAQLTSVGAALCSVEILAHACARPAAGGLQIAMTLFALINLWPATHFFIVSRRLRQTVDG